MGSENFFPSRPQSQPKIYAYEDTHPQYAGLLKVGYTTIDVRKRVEQQYPTKKPGKDPYRIVLEVSAMRNDGSAFTDHDVHRYLRNQGVSNPEGEWFACPVNTVKAAVTAIRSGQVSEEDRSLDFKMRPEQVEAVEKTADYFNRAKQEEPDKTPHFLWNAKMRFGKTFAAYQLAKKMGWNKVLVMTFKPAVQHAWESDLKQHVDFKGWQLISPGGLTYEDADKNKPFVCFGSFQDYLGRNKSTGGLKTKNEWVHTINWDCVILDEYHYGSWRQRAKDLFLSEDEKEILEEDDAILKEEGYADIDFDEEIIPITTDAYLYLSGTPFRAIASGEFIEEQIYNWTYSDEQRAKQAWKGKNNPYLCLPRMVLMTYQLPDVILDIARQGEYDEFDLNVFFHAEGSGEDAKFKYEDEVQKWLNLIRGALQATTIDDLKLGARKPPFPFSDVRLLNILQHTFWFLPSVAACYAMKNLLLQKQNRFYHDYQVVVAAGNKAGIGVKALPPVLEAMDDPLNTKTITLSCGKLTTGITIRPWTGIFMLRNSSSPETYFQAAFRVQSPWTVKNPDGKSPNHEEIIKKECYIFDFAPDRALRQIAEYSCRLNVEETNPEKKVDEFISFLPILAYDGSSMKQVDAAGVLDIAMSGTSATLLARRWESALLVNVDNITLQRLMSNEAAMKALMSIVGFRSLNQDIEMIINKSEAVKKVRKSKNDEDLSPKEKKQLTEEEKEYKSKRKQIQEKLIKFATRIPLFMYLTDFRERSLQDVITQLEPGLFRKVTGLTIKDFELLVSLGLFNSQRMNEAVLGFKRYEDSSLVYVGIDKHKDEEVGLYDTVLSAADYSRVFENMA
ncbi:MAG: GIY-YIG nuclease family protein [Syntrophaceae bacterium]|nr:GIY-YIG nuclease family protein [Syntrophaceae bacterium]